MTDSEHDELSESFDDWLRRCLMEATKELPPEVESRVLEQGDAAVAPLIAMLEDRALLSMYAPGKGWGPIHAAVLLGKLRAVDAIAALVAALADSEYRDAYAEEVVQALTNMGSAALEPVLQAHAGASEYFHLLDLESILCALGVRDERIFTVLLGALERAPRYGAIDLARYGDERAIEHLRRAFDRPDLEFDSLFEGEAADEVRAALLALGSSLTEEQERRYQRVQAGLSPVPPPRPNVARAARKRRSARKQQKASRKKNRR
jgi:hypothetical protein